MLSQLILLLITLQSVLVVAQKFEIDVRNYSEFLNFGQKKSYDKLNRIKYENSVIKSKVDILGAIFKQNIAIVKQKNMMDLVFLIDASSSVGAANFQSELKFTKKLLSDVTVDYNHTRVAIITFSSSNLIIKNIDEITNPKVENNKCVLLNKEINNINYTGGGTYTLGAFKAAKEIFKHSRIDAQKVLVLITDGYSNGGNPLPIANELKDMRVTIFTIGISNGNYKELYELATKPGEYHSYLLDSFEEFENLARRALHVDLQSGNYYPLGISAPCDGLCETGNCCDQKAHCTCGTSIGQYSCLCELGYYGSGLNNSCLPCPSGSYSQGPNLCLPCPDMHHYTTPPAIGPSSCKCKLGYMQNFETSSCEVISCPDFNAPQNGYIVQGKKCNTALNSACGVRCNVGYTLTGKSIRLCQENGTWSGDTTCQIKTCAKLPKPSHGEMICRHLDLKGNFTTSSGDFPVDTTCHVSCDQGYTLIGSKSRTCLPLAQWDGLRSACKQVKCVKLTKINFGSIEPKSCTIGKQPFGKECKYTCLPGFELSGPSSKICMDGSWDFQEETSCKDTTKPIIECPHDIVQETLPGKAYGLVSWPIPKVSDNSGLNITMWSKPVIKGAHKFKIGTNQVSYYAQDVFNNKNKCSFNVKIVDLEPPTIEGCIDPPAFISYGPANVTWDEPIIFDNSLHVQVNKDGEFGIFPIGITQVNYTAYDNSQNTNYCVLNITIEAPSCPVFNQPVFSTHNCSNSNDGVQCVITCDEGYALPVHEDSRIFDNTTQFFCKYDEGEWKNPAQLNSTECITLEMPVEIMQSGTIEVNVENEDPCNNQKELENYQKILSNNLEDNTIELCNSMDCNIVTEPLHCENNEIGILTKRDLTNKTMRTRHKKRRLSVKFHLKARQNPNKQNRNKSISTNARTSNIKIKTIREDVRCPSGSIRRRLKCIRCPVGTFHNVTSNICQSCTIGSYNDKTGQSICASCPENYSTRKFHAKTITDCIEKCPPGTFAHKKQMKRNRKQENSVMERTTLKPYCSSCPLGTYQSFYGQTSCKICPTNMTTTSRGAKYAEECEQLQDPCVRRPCLYGKCISQNVYDYVCQCDENYIGSNCEIFNHPCNSHPCQNDGVCSYNSKNGFECQCLEGYQGITCGMVANQCDLNCLNSGTCVLAEDDEKICLCENGFGGRLCELEIEKCHKNICQNNGTCIEVDDEFRCICPKGYLGRRCQYLPCDYKPCDDNFICINELVEFATENSYKCMCPLGYTGVNCTEKINYCLYEPCSNNGNCTSLIDRFICDCSKGYVGKYCEIELPRNYVLRFPRSGVTDYIASDGFPFGLEKVAVCFWIKTEDKINYGTIISYANRKYFNAFTITDYSGVVIYINDDHRVTDIVLNDGTWHHFCFTWENTMGNYEVYLDGALKINGTSFGTHEVIEENGKFIIGQEQDSFGGQFSQAESFLGKLSDLDVYNRYLTAENVKKIMSTCLNDHQGDLYAWSEFRLKIRGDIEILNGTFCGKCDPPIAPKFGVINIEDNIAFYTCDKGYKLSNFSQGRKCLKANRWEGIDPVCEALECNYPDYLANGYFIGNNFNFGSKIVYMCNKGFNLTGKAVRTCGEDGKWFPQLAKCEGLKCPKSLLNITSTKLLNITVYSNIEDVLDYNEIENFTVGSQLYIECKNNLEQEGESTLTCMPNGEWDFESPTCKLPENLPCNVEQIPDPPINANLMEDSYNAYVNGLNDKIFYSCKAGYKPIGINYTSCILDGYWSELDMKCEIISCKPPKDLSRFGIKLVDGQADLYKIGHMLRYGCMDKYYTRGQLIARCIHPGIWSKMNGFCYSMTCQKPTLRADIEIIESNNIGTANASIKLLCKNEPKTFNCVNGKWPNFSAEC